MPNNQAVKVQSDFEEFTYIVHESPYLENYKPFLPVKLTKKGWADELSMITGVAAIIGGFNLVWSLMTKIPEDVANKLDVNNHELLGNAVLEAIRIDAPVNNVNVILKYDTALHVGGREEIFPKGMVVAGSIGLTILDGDRYPDPLEFDPY